MDFQPYQNRTAVETLYSLHTSHMINSWMLLLVETTETMTGSDIKMMVCFCFFVQCTTRALTASQFIQSCVVPTC